MSTGNLANRYNLYEPLGEGAMGLVWLADDTLARREVALKVISQQYGTTPKSILQLKQEFRLMTHLRHPNCCEVYDYGVSQNGEPYFTMEVVHGQGFDELLPFPADRFVSVFAQLMQALAYVHQQGFVHRDLKAANVRVRPDGVVKLMDYGLMARAGQATGTITGTVAYLAPEVIKRGPVDPRSDLYSAGCLAYEMLSGRQPFVNDNPMEVVRAHVSERPEPLFRLVPDIPPAIERVVLKLLSKDPLERYQSAAAVLEDLGVEVQAGLSGSLMTSPLVGREREVLALGHRLSRTAKFETGAVLWLCGPSGIGKSRLVEETRCLAQLEGLPCAVGRLSEPTGTPYGPFVAALKNLMPVLKAHVRPELDRVAPVLVKLLPELGSAGGWTHVTPAPDMDHPSKEKTRLQAAVAELLSALSGKTGFVVILEDWHWTDDLSRELLAYLARVLDGTPALFVVTTRDAAPEATDTGLPYEPLALEPLGIEAVRRMVVSMLGSEAVDDAFLTRLSELSEGNPLFLERLLDHLVKHGLLSKQAGHWNVPAQIPTDAVHDNLETLLAQKLEALTPAALAVARAGAILAGEFGLDLLQDVSGLSDDDLFDAMDMLKKHRLLIEEDSGAYRFGQDLVPRVLLNALTPEAEAAWHGRAARALEARVPFSAHQDFPLDMVTEIAHHYLLSDSPRRAITFALEAGRGSARLFATAQAERFLTAGLALMEEDAPEWHSHRLEFLRVLGDVQRVAGQTENARASYMRAIPLAEALDEKLLLGRLLTSLAKVLQNMDDMPGALANCARGLEVSTEAGDKAGMARCLDTSCRLHFFLGEVPQAIEEARQALECARAAGDYCYQAAAMAFLGYLYVAHAPSRIQEGVSYLSEAVLTMVDLGDRLGLINALLLLGNAQTKLGDYANAMGTFKQALETCRVIDYQTEAVFAMLNQGLVALETGAYTETMRLGAEAEANASARQHKYQVGLALLLQAAAGQVLGPLDPSKSRLERALSLAQESRHRYLEGLVHQFGMDQALHLGDFPGALATGEALSSLVEETGFKDLLDPWRLMEATRLARLGRPQEARPLVAQVLATAELGQARGLMVQAMRVKTAIAMQEAAWDEADRTAREGLSLAREIGARRHEAELESLLGEIALATGNGEAASRYRTLVLIAEEMNSPLHQALAQFGLAAAAPYADNAKALADDAKAILEKLLQGASPETRAQFLGLQERARVMAGNYIAFSLPVAKREDAAPATRPPGMGSSDLWKMM